MHSSNEIKKRLYMQELGEAAKILVYLEVFREGFRLAILAAAVGIIIWRCYAK